MAYWGINDQIITGKLCFSNISKNVLNTETSKIQVLNWSEFGQKSFLDIKIMYFNHSQQHFTTLFQREAGKNFALKFLHI